MLFLLVATTKKVVAEPSNLHQANSTNTDTSIDSQEHLSAAGDLCRKTGTSEIREHSKLILFDLFSEDVL